MSARLAGIGAYSRMLKCESAAERDAQARGGFVVAIQKVGSTVCASLQPPRKSSLYESVACL